MEEKWLPISGYEGLYEISNKGRVKSLEKERLSGRPLTMKTRKEKILKNGVQTNGYYFVSLTKDGNKKSRLIHRLVITAFKNPSKLVVNHKNSNKKDNNIENLEYCTNRENSCHGASRSKTHLLGAYKKGKKWAGRIMMGSKNVYLGTFDTELEAHNAYVEKLKELNLPNKYI